jgi:hypothetical protein
MEITHTPAMTKKMEYVNAIFEMNQYLCKALVVPLDQFEFQDLTLKCMEALADHITESMRGKASPLTEQQALIAAVANLIAVSSVDLPPDMEVFPDFVLDEIAKHGKIFSFGEYENDPYVRTIEIEECEDEEYETGYMQLRRYEPFIYQFLYSSGNMGKNGLCIPCIGLFDYDASFPYLRIGDEVLESVSINEIYACKEPIRQAHGNVLALGLRLGYFAFMASQKTEVHQITVVEENEKLASYVQFFLLPQFPNGGKVEIVTENPFDYLSTVPDGKFDFCFIDLWDCMGDAVRYLAAKEFSKKFKRTSVTFSLEHTLIGGLMDHVIIAILDAYGKNAGIEAAWIGEMDEQEVFEYYVMKRMVRDAVIKKPSDVDFYTDPDNIIRFMEKKRLL